MLNALAIIKSFMFFIVKIPQHIKNE
ncbi:hypothetical protein ATQ42_24015 [Salmonella enterica]|nr:hypothetical protein [Salmonella enterica]